MTHGDYVPDSAQNLRDWADNYIKQLPDIATRIGWPPASVTALIAMLTALRDAAQAVVDAQNVLKTNKGLLGQARTDNLPSIRQNTANLKSTAGFTDGDAKTLEVATSSAVLNPDTYKPVLNAHAHPGYNEVMGKKRGVQAINIYMRLKATATWKLIAAGRTTFPFNDDTPPVTPGQPEEREYMGMGIMNDKEIGQPSDIVSAVFRSM
ncbi:MAG: hypothetical protein ABI946_05770 [Chthoniobacterales bacterium]